MHFAVLGRVSLRFASLQEESLCLELTIGQIHVAWRGNRSELHHYNVCTLAILCKLTSCIVYSSPVQSFKQIPLFFFPLLEHEWVVKIRDGWLVAELLDPTALL